MMVTNLSQFVLDISPANGTTANLTVDPYTSYQSLPTAGELEVEVQNAAVANLTPPSPTTVLLPVGGQVAAATSHPPVQVEVQVDQQASAASFGAILMTSYVVSNVPANSILDYANRIANASTTPFRFGNRSQNSLLPPWLTWLA